MRRKIIVLLKIMRIFAENIQIGEYEGYCIA